MNDDEVLTAVKTILVQARNGYHVSINDVAKASRACSVIAQALAKCSAQIVGETDDTK